MTRDEVRAAAERLVQWHQRFAGLFGRKEARTHSLTYLYGLLSDQTRKSVEPIALRFARSRSGGPATQNEVVAMQEFVTASPWEAGDVFREIQTVFTEELAAPPTADEVGTVGVIDESGFVKAGSESVGVAPQYCGRWGQTMNCQVGVFLVGVASRGVALLDAQLYLPQEWIDDYQHRQRVGDAERSWTPNSICCRSGSTIADGGRRPMFPATSVFKPNRRSPSSYYAALWMLARCQAAGQAWLGAACRSAFGRGGRRVVACGNMAATETARREQRSFGL